MYSVVFFFRHMFTLYFPFLLPPSALTINIVKYTTPFNIAHIFIASRARKYRMERIL